MSSVPAYIHLAPGSTPPSLGARSPFRAVVIIDQSVATEWQWLVSDWLVQSGCLCMMAWGQDCSSWDDSVDLASLKKHDFGEIPDDDFIMTSWHTDESLEEVFWFAKNSAFHPVVELETSVLVHVAADADAAYLLQVYDEA